MWHSTLLSAQNPRRADLGRFPGDVRMGALRHQQEEVAFLRADEPGNDMVQVRKLVDVVRPAFARPVQPNDQRILLAHFVMARACAAGSGAASS